MRLPLRLRLLLAIGLPLLVVWIAVAALLLGGVRGRAVRDLEASALARIEGLARRLEDRFRTGGVAALEGRALEDIDRQVAEQAHGVAYLVVGPDGRILHGSLPPDPSGRSVFDLVRELGRPDLETHVRAALAGARGVTPMQGVLASDRRWVAYAPVPTLGGAVFASAPESVLLVDLRSRVTRGLVVFLGGAIAVLAVVAAMAARVTRPLSQLAAAVGRLGRGDLATRVEGVEREDEIGDLATGFNRMVGDLEQQIEARRREEALRQAVEGELRAGRRIQQALLPKRLPTGGRFALSAGYLPARHVAGDFYDAFVAEDGIVFLVADVAGKGLPSALFMAMSKTVLQRELVTGPSLAAAVRTASDALEREQVGSMYLTVFVGRFDPASGRLRYVNAGHPPPWRLLDGVRPAPLGPPTGGPVGLLPGRTFEECEAVLEPGATLVVFSDGVPEARRTVDDEMFGDERLAALLAALPARSAPSAVCEEVLGGVRDFQSENLADDVTVMVLQRTA